MNFSKERFMHMLEVGKVTFQCRQGTKQASIQKMTVSKPTNQSAGTKSSSSSNPNGKKDQTLM